jgi:hypothetical protein
MSRAQAAFARVANSLIGASAAEAASRYDQYRSDAVKLREQELVPTGVAVDGREALVRVGGCRS